MKLAELQVILRAADARAVLVPPHILDQIIQEACHLRGSVWRTPHRNCYVVDRQTLFRHVDQAYLALAPDQLLPDTVILLSDPPTDELSDLESKMVLLKYWRRLFHANIHLQLDANHSKCETDAGSERVAHRVAEIGHAEFAEIRTVLEQDHFLLPNADEQTAFVEFAAVYLETRYFNKSLLSGLFPGLRDFDRIDHLLAKDVDSDALFTATRLANAPDPVTAIDTGSEEPESQERYWTLVRSAQRASQASNTVRAAILRTRAWRIAPASLGLGTREEALADMRRLTARLAATLKLTPEEAAEWGRDLPLLLDKADQGEWPAEAKLLYDLQKVCADDERDVYALDVVEWVLSGGKRPIKRPLPSLALARITRNLRGVTRHLGAVRLSDADRQHFSNLLQGAIDKAEQSVRDRFGPVLLTALQDVGLQPTNPPERVALSKMVAEWLDRIISHGFLTFSDLRDTISRNQLKMPDIRDPRDFMRGDPLLRLDRRLASLLDGVYRPSDVYMRWLEQVTAANFGTRLGRAITLWVTIPLGGAALLLQLFGILLHLLFNLNQHRLLQNLYFVLVGPSRYDAAAGHGVRLVFHFFLLTALAIFLMALIHVEDFRRPCHRALAKLIQAIRKLLIELPAALLQRASLQKILTSPYSQLLWWYVLRPLVICVPLWFLLPRTFRHSGMAIVFFAIISLLLNSRIGEAATAAVGHGIKSLGDQIRAGLLRGLYRFIVRAFQQIIDTVELVLFTVDDWLRYRRGDSQASLVVRTTLGVLWFPVSYLARFYMLVLIEPGFNPAKAPVSYLAAKVMLPLSVPLSRLAIGTLTPLMWDWLAYAIALPTIWLLPDVFGFLFWETKENWRLYRANRLRTLRSVPVGPHGETVKALLQPGFHSGTIPRLYRRLRHAEERASRTRNWAAARACRQELDEVRQSIERFVARDLLGLIRESADWEEQPLKLGTVGLAVNRITIDLLHPIYPGRPVRIEFEFSSGWLIAGLRSIGWLEDISSAQSHAFVTVLASVYKLSAVDLVREQVAAHLPTPSSTWEVTPEGLLVWGIGEGPPQFFPLRESDDPRLHVLSNGVGDASRTGFDTRRLIFARTPVYWQQWLGNWQRPTNGQASFSRDLWDRELIPPLSDRGVGDEVFHAIAEAARPPEAGAPLPKHGLTSAPVVPEAPGATIAT